MGFNATIETLMNMLEAGIVDSTKLTHSALQHAPSVSALFLATKAVVADKPEPTPPMHDMSGMGIGGNAVGTS